MKYERENKCVLSMLLNVDNVGAERTSSVKTVLGDRTSHTKCPVTEYVYYVYIIINYYY